MITSIRILGRRHPGSTAVTQSHKSAALRRLLKLRPAQLHFIGMLALSICGCTTVSDYVANGFKVGPAYQRPPAPVAQHWIDDNDARVRSVEGDDSHWWTVFNDPKLNYLVQTAYQQNLTLREAGFRVLQNRALLTGADWQPLPANANHRWQLSTHFNLSQEVANRSAPRN